MTKLNKNIQKKEDLNKNKIKKIIAKKKTSSNIDIKSLQNELKEAKEDNLRHLAEIENLRKRFDKEQKDTFNYAISEFANEIILVADNFTRVMNSISLIKTDDKNNVKPLVDGIDLIFKDFINTLGKFEIKKVECLGKQFDPNFHQAMSEELNNEKQPGEIIKVIQDGYFIKDRLLRPASVVVAKKDENKKK
jgi:molecular chaperone GrpE|tara:strand:- start:812 stop:1387 length:576 start_codon:yes stop_codon:yes gene_type:complete